MNGISPLAYSIDFASLASVLSLFALVRRWLGAVGMLVVLAVAGVLVASTGKPSRHPADPGDHLLLRHDDRPGPHRTQRRALASVAVPDHPGSGSAVLGFVQWVAAGIIAPIAGLGGEHTAFPWPAS